MIKCEIVGGLVGDALDGIGDSIKGGIVDGFTWIAESIFNFLDPFINWGCQIVIVCCVLTYFCSNDKKLISTAFKAGFIYLVFNVIKGAIAC